MSGASKMLFSSLAVLLLVASLAFAQETATVAKGEKLFKTYCAACHSIGAGVLVGPDLKGVTARRTLGWLKGFIRDPSRMVKEKDPAAIELVAKFNGFIMPTLDLTAQNVADVISYLRSKSPSSGE